METISRLALTFLLNSLWQVTALVLIASCCSRLLRKAPASYRHLLWATTLALGLLLPLWSAIGFGRASLPWSSSIANEAFRREYAASPAANSTWLADLLRARSSSVSFAPSLLSALAAVYLLFLLYRLTRLRSAWLRTNEIRRSARLESIPDFAAAIREQCRVAFGLKEISILCSSIVKGPVTLGTKRAVIILPQSMLLTASPDLILSALGHEMAHIRRRDFLFNLIYELIHLPISFHPASIYAKRRIKETREIACDEMVTERLMSPKEYARSLVSIASSMTSLDNPTYSLGIFDANNLEERIMKLTQRSPRASARLAKALLVLATLALALSAIAASAFSLSIGQDKHAESSSAQKSIVGSWLLFPKEDGQSEEAPGITLVLYSNDGRLSGKVIHKARHDHADAEDKDAKDMLVWPLVDAQFDGSNLSFRVYPPDKDNPNNSNSHYMEGKLKLTGDEFVGRWTSSEGHSGTLRMIRKKE